MPIKFPVAILVISSLVPTLRCEIYSSSHTIEQAFYKERIYLNDVDAVLTRNDKYIEDQHNRTYFREFRKFINETIDLHLRFKTPEDVKTYLGHPVNIYHFIRRCVHEWPRRTFYLAIPRLRPSQAIYSLGTDLENVYIYDQIWPRMEDLTALSLSLITLKQTYDLDLKELANGTVSGTKHDPLTVDEFYDIALVSIEKMMPRSALEWFSETLRRIESGEVVQSPTLTATHVRLKMIGLLEKHFDNDALRRVCESLRDHDPVSHALLFKRNPELEAKVKVTEDTFPPWDKDDKYNDYMKICRGDIETFANQTKELFCLLKKTAIPYRPAKVEFLSNNPPIALYHDVIYDEEIRAIKEEAIRSKMVRSQVQSETGKEMVTIDNRVSRNAFIIPDGNHLLDRVNSRMQEILGLRADVVTDGSVAPREAMQVVNYGPGGFYGPHWDFFRNPYTPRPKPEDPVEDDRYATWLFYLDEVDVGGFTVFPDAKPKVRVPVVKGAAVFWWNMYRNGTEDLRSYHAGCPVLLGTKWIANVWFHYIDQWNYKPCTLKQTE